MSNRRYIIFSVAIGAFLAGGFLTAFRFAESKSIINLLNKHSQLVNALAPIPADGAIPRGKFDGHKYLNELVQIDTSFCPKKFESAWLDYIRAVKQAFDQDLLRAELVVGAIGVASKTPFLAKTVVRPIEATDAVERAWQNVERVALEYNVQFFPDIALPRS